MPRRLPLLFLFALLALLALPRVAPAQTKPAEPTVSVLTFGPGPLVFERFGHIAIRIQAPSRGIDVSYDWGNFDFEQSDFIARFVLGDTRYWMMGKYTEQMLPMYLDADRTVIEQRLNLDATQVDRLIDALRSEDTEANRYYRYDYFRDNCSTRVRDVIDQAVGGQLKPAMATVTPHSFRWHTRRLLSVGADNRVLSALIDFCFGSRVDARLSEWELAFLPMELSAKLDAIQVIDSQGLGRPLVAERRVLNLTTSPGNADPAIAGRPVIATTLFGVIGALLLVGLARAWWPGFVVVAVLWEAWAAFAFVFLCLMGAFTRHWVFAWNLNVLQFSPLALALIVALLFKRSRMRLQWAAPAALVLSVIGAILSAMPFVAQQSLPAIGLALPLHAAVFHVLRGRPNRPALEGNPS